jgi:hypothetical protein
MAAAMAAALTELPPLVDVLGLLVDGLWPPVDEPPEVEDEEGLERSAMPMPAPVTPEASAITTATAIATGASRAGLRGAAGG